MLKAALGGTKVSTYDKTEGGGAVFGRRDRGPAMVARSHTTLFCRRRPISCCLRENLLAADLYDGRNTPGGEGLRRIKKATRISDSIAVHIH